MTERLYYDEPYRTSFTAQVVEQLTWKGHPAVVLDRTAFYPTSGGQPADRGSLGEAPVIDVAERPADGEILHVLAEVIPKGQVVGHITWPRRFDHMQQHTGQHVLSAAFERVLQAATVGFHLGAESSTIDVARPDLEMEDILPVETAANNVVWADRPVRVRWLPRDAVADLSLTEVPADVEGPLRLVEILGSSAEAEPPLDVNPCGGTHVSRTGEIGLIKLVGREHRGDKTRIEFLCGARALRDYEAKRNMTFTLAARLTVGTWELDEAVRRLQEENKTLRKTQRALQERLLDMEAAHLARAAETYGPYQVVGRVWQQRRPQELRTLARKLVERDDLVALLFSAPAVSVSSVDDRVHLCFARSERLDLDVNELLQRACARLGGKGGGRPEIAQGSAPAAAKDVVMSVLGDLEAALERAG